MRKLSLSLVFTAAIAGVTAQKLVTADPTLDRAFGLATATLYDNTPDSLIKAGGEYGGEWTRDVSINAWNAASLLIPEKTRYSLWSVTTDDRTMIGHQYWDQIIWVTGAHNHFRVTRDSVFLRQAYIASANTILKLEREAFDTQYGLFTGPSVFNDGIAGYEEPIWEPGNSSSYVLDYPASKNIKCLSTNCIYYEAYDRLARMAASLNDWYGVQDWGYKADRLRKNIRKHLFDSSKHRLNYLIDGNGKVHPHQEGLGIAYAILFDIVTPKEAGKIVDRVYTGNYGLPSVYPCFKRFSVEKPGRHNAIVWPFISAFWAEAALKCGRENIFERELRTLADLAVNKGKDCFWEIYNMTTGEVDGGWQCGHQWSSVHHQTWSATGYLRMVFWGVLGMSFEGKGMTLAPDFAILRRIGFRELSDLRYQNGTVNIKRNGDGDKLVKVLVNGISQDPATNVSVPSGHKGITTVEYIFR